MAPLLVLSAEILSAISAVKNRPVLIDNALETNESNNIPQIFVKTEDVDVGTKCYVSKESVQAVNELGWKTREDEIGYFYETTPAKQKIVSISTFDTNLDELRDKIVVAENWAITYQSFHLNPDALFMNNAALGYVRSFNSGYVTGDDLKRGVAWLATAGSINSTLNHGIDNTQNCIEYFSNFVSNNDYSVNYHISSKNPHASERSTDTEFSYFKDPITKKHDIDLIHMFASMDACYDWTLWDASKRCFIPCIYPEMVHDLASWGGDLQQAASAIQQRIDNEKDEFDLEALNNFNFKSIMLGDYGCSESDIYADIDAINITDKWLTGAGRTSDSLASYYGSTYSDEMRMNKFIEAVLNDKNSDWSGTVKEQFKQEVYDIMGLANPGNNYVESEDYNSDSAVSKMKFSIMKSNVSNVQKEVRKAVADTFCDYVFSIC